MSKKCPYCGEEMEQGYIQCRDGLWWTKKKRLVPSVPPVLSAKEPTVKLGKSSANPYGDAVAEAYCCLKCKKVMIDYE